jgi:ADP-ribose pyrophosphatase YjhB (NUDIX family)
MPHIHDKIDFVAGTFIVRKNKVLLRMHDKYGMWLDPGGHVELDEEPSQAAVREAKEETGLDVSLVGSLPNIEVPKDTTLLIPPRFMQRHRVSETHEHISMIYFATCESDALNPGDGESIDNLKWFTAEELKDSKYDIREDIKFYALEALRELGTAA